MRLPRSHGEEDIRVSPRKEEEREPRTKKKRTREERANAANGNGSKPVSLGPPSKPVHIHVVVHVCSLALSLSLSLSPLFLSLYISLSLGRSLAFSSSRIWKQGPSVSVHVPAAVGTVHLRGGVDRERRRVLRFSFSLPVTELPPPLEITSSSSDILLSEIRPLPSPNLSSTCPAVSSKSSKIFSPLFRDSLFSLFFLSLSLTIERSSIGERESSLLSRVFVRRFAGKKGRKEGKRKGRKEKEGARLDRIGIRIFFGYIIIPYPGTALRLGEKKDRERREGDLWIYSSSRPLPMGR